MMNMGRLKRFVLASIAVLGLAGVNMIPAKAATPLFYDGNVTWAIGRRDTSDSEDFNYTTLQENLPRFGSLGYISPQLCGIPGNASTTTFQHIPSFISVNSPELAANGGYVYVGFCFAYCTMDSWGSNVSFTYSGISQSLSRAGSLAYSQGANSVPLTRDRNNLTTKNTNSTFEIDPSPLAIDIPDIYPSGFQLPDGANFAKQAYFGYALSGYYSPEYTFFNYGDTASFWARTFFYSCRIYVPPGYQPDGYNTVWIDLTNSLTASFKSTATTLLFEKEGTPVTATGFECACVYLCPVFCYATSLTAYEEIEYYLDSIDSNVSALSQLYSSPSAEQQAWLDQYNSYVNQQKQYASSAANAMNYSFTSPDDGNLDVSGYVDAQAKSRFSGVLSLIFSHSKIGAILILSATCAIIGYIFFGKRSQS